MSDVIVGNGIVQLDVQDTLKLKAVLFGGEPWLVYCVNQDTAPWVQFRVEEGWELGWEFSEVYDKYGFFLMNVINLSRCIDG